MIQSVRKLIPHGDPSSPAKSFVLGSYQHISTANDPATLDLLDVWLERFRLIHGELDTQRQQDIAAVPRACGAEPGTRRELFLFIYVLEAYFATVLRLLGYRAAIGRATADVEPEIALAPNALASAGILNYSIDPEFDCVHQRPGGPEAIKALAPLVDEVPIEHYDRDLIKHLHHEIFPRQLRHSLGEIYTPDWLVELALDDVTAGDNAPEDRSYGDPTCGSGTFLVELVSRFGERSSGRILDRIVGFDINPVSALAAKTNLILAGKRWLKLRSQPYVLPVFETDCIATPSTLSSDLSGLLEGLGRGRSVLPEAYRAAHRVSQEGNESFSRDGDKLAALVATTLVRGLDYIVGNPPWVNWEYLPDDYRSATVNAWQHYGLFDLKGRDMTFIKEDISALITYVAADRYLRLGGKLGFVIKQTLFKSSRQGEGFRKFRLGADGVPLGVRKVEDLARIRAFPGIAARTALLVLEKGVETEFPVEYNEWQPDARSTFKETESLEAVRSSVRIQHKHAYPSDPKKPCSGWTSLLPGARDEMAKVFGSSAYRARTGVFTGGLNAVYWIQVLEDRGSKLLVRNLTASARNKVRDIEAEVDKELVYPFVRGSDLDLWRFEFSKYILLPHTIDSRMAPLEPAELRDRYPSSWQYLSGFQPELEARKGFAGWEKHLHRKYFYALQRIGAYTFARYKVAWKFIARAFVPVVIGPVRDKFVGPKIAIPNEKVIYVGLDEEDEAYFVCGVLSATIYRRAVESFMVETQIGPAVLDKLRVPRFDACNAVHRRISAVCRAGHESGDVERIDGEIDRLVNDI